MNDILPQPFFPVFPPLSAIHTPAGQYVYLSDKAFRHAGIDTDRLLGRKWQDFAPDDQLEVETTAVKRALATGLSVTLDRVRRNWNALPIALDVTITPIRSRRRSHLVLRTARVIPLGA